MSKRGLTRLLLVGAVVLGNLASVPLPAEAVDSYYSVDVTYDKNNCVWECATDPLLIYKYGSVTVGIPTAASPRVGGQVPVLASWPAQ